MENIEEKLNEELEFKWYLETRYDNHPNEVNQLKLERQNEIINDLREKIKQIQGEKI